MSRQIATMTSRRGIILNHPANCRELVDAGELADVDVVECGAFGHRGATRTNLLAYAGCLPAVFVPNFNPGTYATCAALSQRSADRMRVVGYCHTYHEYYFDLLRQYEPIIHRFVAVSAECFRRLRGLLPHRANDILLRPYGVKVSRGLERGYSSPGQPIQLLYAGRIDETQKCVSALLRLAGELTRQRVDYRLQIVGDGPDEASLRAQHASLDAETRDRVELRPGVPHVEMPAILRAADVAVLASAYEGTSIFMLEAMAHGCVPVVTRVSGTADVIESNVNGAYAEVGDVVGLAAEVKRLHLDRDSLARQGRRSYECSVAYSDETYLRWFNGLC
ncbi:MAG: glycosyltransferase family 4 protein, partial [Acidobacteriota bacterium]